MPEAAQLLYLPSCTPEKSNSIMSSWSNDEDDEYYSDEDDLREDHTTEPIKNLEDIEKIYAYFMDRHRYKNAVMFTVGINVAMRITDMLNLRFKTFYKNDWTPKIDTFVLESKTKRTKGKRQKRMDMEKLARKTQCMSRDEKIALLGQIVDEADEIHETNKKRKMVPRRFKANDLVYQALDAYRATWQVAPKLDDYIFCNTSHYLVEKNKPMSRQYAWKIFDQVSEKLNLGIRIGTHGLRKTFGYHMMDINNNSDEALHVLQQLFGHSSPEVTLRYIGITRERINSAYDDVGKRMEQVIVYPQIIRGNINIG